MTGNTRYFTAETTVDPIAHSPSPCSPVGKCACIRNWRQGVAATFQHLTARLPRTMRCARFARREVAS